jgi:carbonyl reductase 1
MQAQGVLVAACCPGYCATDMSSWRGTKTAAAGADTPVWLALQPAGAFQSGKFWQERREIGY